MCVLNRLQALQHDRHIPVIAQKPTSGTIQRRLRQLPGAEPQRIYGTPQGRAGMTAARQAAWGRPCAA